MLSLSWASTTAHWKKRRWLAPQATPNSIHIYACFDMHGTWQETLREAGFDINDKLSCMKYVLGILFMVPWRISFKKNLTFFSSIWYARLYQDDVPPTEKLLGVNKRRQPNQKVEMNMWERRVVYVREERKSAVQIFRKLTLLGKWKWNEFWMGVGLTSCPHAQHEPIKVEKGGRWSRGKRD